jgi:ribosomal protein S18 acetylase RimI-like enzyme
MNPDFRIRTATADDAAALVRLNEAFNGVSEPPERLAERLRDPRCIETPILAEIDDHAVGFAALRVAPSVFYATPHTELTELYVEPAYRRRGIARALLGYAETRARAQGADSLYILTGFENYDAQRLYRLAGYEDNDLSMIKSLDND